MSFEGEVANLIEEQGPAMGLLEMPFASNNRPCESPLHMTEELGVSQLGRDGSAVHRNEGLPSPLASRANGFCKEFLASASLA